MSVFRILLGVVAAYFGVAWTLGSNIASNVAGFFMMFFPLRNLLREKQVPLAVSTRRAAAYGIPMTFALLAGTSLYSADVILVKHFLNPHAAGIYMSLSVLGKIIFFASFAITSVLFPTIAEHKEKGNNYRHIVWMGAGSVAGISFFVTTCYFLFPRLVVHLLFGSAYDEAVQFVGWFGIFLSFISLSTLFIQTYLAEGKTIVSYIASVAAVLQVVLLFFFHTNIMQIILVNVSVTGSLCAVLVIGFLVRKTV
jgi:O-antigen/teichoic acid export membrane protein